MFTSKTFIIFLIPLALFGMFIWFVATTNIDRDDVRVGGALVSQADVELSVTSCSMIESEGARKLVVEMEGRNEGSVDINLNPKYFKLVLMNNETLDGLAAPKSVFNPMRYTSTCEKALNSVSRIPPDAVRSVTLVFWGETMPSGDEWDEHLLSLEYYDEGAGLMVSRLLNPAEE